jgi:hypothetical protein
MGTTKSFDIRNLLAFHKPGNGLPKSAGGPAEKIADLDPNLSPEEQVYVGHYVGYADILLGAGGPAQKPVEEKAIENRVIEMRGQVNQEPSQAKRTPGKDEAA